MKLSLVFSSVFLASAAALAHRAYYEPIVNVDVDVHVTSNAAKEGYHWYHPGDRLPICRIRTNWRGAEISSFDIFQGKAFIVRFNVSDYGYNSDYTRQYANSIMADMIFYGECR